MSKYFAVLNDDWGKNIKISLTLPVSKVSKGGFDTFDTYPPAHILKNNINDKAFILSLLINPDSYFNAKEAFEERAGIREYDGGYTRAEAEILALDDVLNMFNRCLN